MPIGCLLIHGFSVTPPVVGFLKERLEQAGMIVETPLLAGHGGDWKGYEDSRWEDWYGSVREGYQQLKSRVDSVVVAGQSLGGILSLKLAADFTEIKKVACLATPLFLDSLLARLLMPIVCKTFIGKFYRFHPKAFIDTLSDRSALKQFKEWSYPKLPVKGILSIRDFLEMVRPELKKIEAPVLVIHSKNDPLVSRQTEEFFKKSIQKLKMILLEKSGHIISMDYEKEIVAREMIHFFKGDPA
ncbi:MAG: alpha/beta fold hydrolase [bacterium]|nr:alpha/beta fold hydrolase [bacterium]